MGLRVGQKHLISISARSFWNTPMHSMSQACAPRKVLVKIILITVNQISFRHLIISTHNNRAADFALSTFVGLNLYMVTICSLTEKAPFSDLYFKVLGQKMSCFVPCERKRWNAERLALCINRGIIPRSDISHE